MDIFDICYIQYDVHFFFLLSYCTNSAEKTRRNEMGSGYNEDQNEDMELPFFDLSTIVAATQNFSLENKIGQGGFGPVYRVIRLL